MYVEYVLDVAKKLVEELHTNQDSERARIQKQKTKIEKAMRELEDSRFVTQTLSEESFVRIYARYEIELKQVKEEEALLSQDHSEKIRVLERVLRLAENIGNAFNSGNTVIKRKYLHTFFKRFYVKGKQIVGYELQDAVKPAIEEGSVLIKENWLPLVDVFRTFFFNEELVNRLKTMIAIPAISYNT